MAWRQHAPQLPNCYSVENGCAGDMNHYDRPQIGDPRDVDNWNTSDAECTDSGKDDPAQYLIGARPGRSKKEKEQ